MTIDLRKTLAVGGTAAAILGIGGTALAVNSPDTTDGKDTSHSKHSKHGAFKRLEHGQFVTKAKAGAVTHTIFRGTVTAVSPTSITVQAADKKSQTYVVGKDTKIRERTKGAKPTTSSIAKIAKGDQVLASGTGTSTVTAKQIVEFAK